MQSGSLLLLLLVCCTAVTVTLGASVQAKSSDVAQAQQQCVINKQKIMADARRYYKAKYETKLLLLNLRVSRQQLLEKRRRYQAYLLRMRHRHKVRIQRRIRRFKRQARKVRKAYRRKLRHVTKRFQVRVMRKIKVKPLSSRRIRLINRVFFKKGIISKRAARIARKPVKITPKVIVVKHVKRKAPHFSKKAQIKRLKVRRLLTKTQRLVRAQIKHQIKKLRINKCCRGRGRRHILVRRIKTLRRLLMNHIMRERRRRVMWKSRRRVARRLRKIVRRAKRSRRRAIRKLRRIRRKLRSRRGRRSRRVIRRLLVQRRRLVNKIVRRRRLIRRIARRRRQVIKRFVHRRIRRRTGRGRRSRRIRRRNGRGRRSRRIRRRTGRGRRSRRIRRRRRLRRVRRRQSRLRRRVPRRRRPRIIRPRRSRIAKKVIRRAHRMAVRVKRKLRKILRKRRRLVRIKRRRVALKRRVSKMVVRRRSLKRRIAAVRARRARLIRRIRLLRLRKAKIGRARKVTPKHQPKKVSKKVSVKRITKKAKRTVRRAARINKRLRRLASRVSLCTVRVHHLKRRRVNMKKLIFKVSKRQRRLKQRLVVIRKKSHRQVRKLKKLIALKRRYIRLVISRRLVSRKTIRLIVKRDRRVIRRTVRRKIHKGRRPAKRHRRVIKRRGLRKLVQRSAIVLKTKRVFISGTKVIIPRLLTPKKPLAPGLKRKVVMLKHLNRKLRSEKIKVTLRLNTRSAIRKIVRPRRVRMGIRTSVKKVLGGKKLLRVTKTETIAKKILLSKKPSIVRNLKKVQSNLRRKLKRLKRKLATASPALKNLILQKKAAYKKSEKEVKSEFSHTIIESKKEYGKLINKQKWLYHTEYETLVSEEYKTSEEEIDPKTKKWVVKSTTTVWSHFSVGCFKDAAKRDLKLLAETSNSMSLSRCRDKCRDKGFPFFGVQNGNECRCGSSYGSHGVAKASSCSKKCSGNKDQLCGGVWHNSIYSTGLSGYRLLNVGCYHDKSDRDLAKLAISSSSMSLLMCTKSCGGLGYKYFGVQNSNECWCGNTYGRHGQAGLQKCNMPCRGDKGSMCGGAWLNSVYKTGLSEGGSVTHEIAKSIMSNDNSGDSSKWTEISSTSQVVGAPVVTTTTETSEDKAGPVTTHVTQQGKVATKSSVAASKVASGKSNTVKTVNPDGSISSTEISETQVSEEPTVTVTKSEPVETTHTVVESSTK